MFKITSYESRRAAWGHTSFFFHCELKGKEYRGTINLVPVQGHVATIIANSSERTLAFNSGVKHKLMDELIPFFRNLEAA